MAASSTKNGSLILFLLIFLFASCSLNYTEELADVSTAPEFTLRAASYFRYEDNAITFSLDSPRIEQYASPALTFVEDAEFSSYTKEGEVETKGKCSLLSISQSNDRKNSELTFYSNFVMEKTSDGTLLETNSLKWNTGSGKVASAKDSFTTITKDGLTIEGLGFSAQEKDSQFSFSSQVTGFIVTDDEEEAE